MYAALLAPGPAVPLIFKTVATLGQRALSLRRRTLCSGVEIVMPRPDPSAYYVDLAESRPRQIPFRAWPERAACRGKEETLFFREDNDAAATRRRAFSESRKVCVSCVVIEDCLQHALTQPEEFGVWGGTHALQRKDILARIESGDTTLEEEIEQCLTM